MRARRAPGTAEAHWAARRQAFDAKASAAGPLIARFDAGHPIRTPDRFDRLAKEAVVDNVIGYLCVMLIASAVASIRIMVFRGDQELTAHPVIDLLRRQNPMSRGARWWRDLVAFHRSAGNAYIESVRPGPTRPPRELWILRPDRIEIVAAADGMPGSYKYEFMGQQKLFEVDFHKGPVDLLHVRDFHPLNDWYGLSPVAPAARYIDLDNAAADLNITFLQNGAAPGGLLTFKERLPDDQRKAAEARIRNIASGPRNAGRTLVLGGDWTYTSMSSTLADMQWAQGVDHAARRICAAWGVPHCLVVPGESTYANREQARLEWWEHEVIPYAQMLLDDVGTWLADQFDEPELHLRIDRQAITALDQRRVAQRREAREDYKAGGITLNEYRAELDYGEVENGNDFYEPPMAQQVAQRQDFAASQAELTRQFRAGLAKPGPDDPAPEPDANADQKPKPKPKPGSKGGQGGPAQVPFDAKAAQGGTFAALRVDPKSATRLAAWVAEQDVPNPVPPEDMHVTIAYSQAPLPSYVPTDRTEQVEPGAFDLAFLDPDGDVLALLIDSPLAQSRHTAAAEAGAIWTFATFRPHVTLSYAAGGIMPAQLPDFPIVVGPEYVEPLEPAGKHAPRLLRKVEPGDYAGLPDELDDEAMARETVPSIRNILRHFGQRVVSALNLEIAFDVRSLAMERFLTAFAGERIKELVGSTTRAALGKALADVTASGPTFTKLVSAVRDTFAAAGRDRAEVIARTETTRAAGAGAQEGMRQGDVERRMWLSSRDAFVRDAHRVLDGQIRPLDEPFDYSGRHAMHPGDFGVAGLDINCRCVCVALPDEKAALDLASKEARDVAWAGYDDELRMFEAELATAVKAGFAAQERKLVQTLTRRIGPAG